jgi:hypothetical protein
MHFFGAQFVAMHMIGALCFYYFMQDIPQPCKMVILGWHASC